MGLRQGNAIFSGGSMAVINSVDGLKVESDKDSSGKLSVRGSTSQRIQNTRDQLQVEQRTEVRKGLENRNLASGEDAVRVSISNKSSGPDVPEPPSLIPDPNVASRIEGDAGENAEASSAKLDPSLDSSLDIEEVKQEIVSKPSASKIDLMS
jgi:hypothetical protein